VIDNRDILVIVALTLATATVAWAHGGAHGPAKAAPPSAEELAAFSAARPVFARYCFKCHTRSGKKAKAKALKHVDMTTYPFGGHHADDGGAVIRRAVQGASGESATMPSDDPGAVQGEDLAKILAWADAFDRAHAKARR
jgi:hypothetical protein